METGHIATDGAELYYEVRGHGVPLLLIAGGGGDGGVFEQVADRLADEFKVITYDRRGNSRSPLQRPANLIEMSRQSLDAVTVLNAVGERDAVVFGNSGGAVIALDMAATQPQAVQAAIVHEPPVLPVLPDAATWRRFFAELYLTAHQNGVEATMAKFLGTLHIPMELNPAELSDAVRESLAATRARSTGNDEYFVINELLPFSTYDPDLERIAANGVPVILAAGELTLEVDAFYGRTAPILAERLSAPMVRFPGHHISFLDRPAPWSETLRKVVRSLQPHQPPY